MLGLVSTALLLEQIATNCFSGRLSKRKLDIHISELDWHSRAPD